MMMQEYYCATVVIFICTVCVSMSKIFIIKMYFVLNLKYCYM